MAERSDLAAEVVEARAAASQVSVEEGTQLANNQSQHRAEEQAKRIEALTLRLAGFTYDQIGTRLEITSASAQRLVTTTLAEAENRSVDQMRELENARLDRVQAAIWAKALDGDLRAVGSFLKISEQRSKINGLYAPTKIDMRVGIRHEMEMALADLERLVTQQAEVISVQSTTAEIEQ